MEGDHKMQAGREGELSSPIVLVGGKSGTRLVGFAGQEEGKSGERGEAVATAREKRRELTECERRKTSAVIQSIGN